MTLQQFGMLYYRIIEVVGFSIRDWGHSLLDQLFPWGISLTNNPYSVRFCHPTNQELQLGKKTCCLPMPLLYFLRSSFTRFFQLCEAPGGAEPPKSSDLISIQEAVQSAEVLAEGSQNSGEAVISKRKYAWTKNTSYTLVKTGSTKSLVCCQAACRETLLYG